jgi:hypothetical protein
MRRIATCAVLCLGLLVPDPAMAVTPANGGPVGGPHVTINADTGDQNDPHVSGDLAAYTYAAGTTSVVRFYDFVSGADASVPNAGERDLLSDVSGGRIAFSRVTDDRTTCMVYEVATNQLIEIAGAPGVNRLGTAIGGNTVAFVDLLVGNRDILVADLPAGAPVNVSISADFDYSPAVAPSGNAVVWVRESADTLTDVLKAVRSGGAWGPPQVVAATADPENHPDTDGTTVVYDSERPTSVGGSDIYFQPLAGGAETQLEILGAQRNASISGGIIAFESTGLEPDAKSDIFLYEIATNRLFQLTDTPTLGEQLSDVSVLADGSIRVVWAADEDASPTALHDVLGATITLPAVPPTQVSFAQFVVRDMRVRDPLVCPNGVSVVAEFTPAPGTTPNATSEPVTLRLTRAAAPSDFWPAGAAMPINGFTAFSVGSTRFQTISGSERTRTGIELFLIKPDAPGRGFAMTDPFSSPAGGDYGSVTVEFAIGSQVGRQTLQLVQVPPGSGRWVLPR